METEIQIRDTYKNFDSNLQALYELQIAVEETFGAKEWSFLRIDTLLNVHYRRITK